MLNKTLNTNLSEKVDVALKFFGLFLFSPILSFVYYNFLNLRRKEDSVVSSRVYIVALSIFLSWINYNKVISSDLIWYRIGYLYAEKLSFFEYIFWYGIRPGKELLFPITNYVFSNLTKWEFSIFLAFITFSFYYVIGLTTIKFFKKDKNRSKITLFLILNLFYFNSLLFSVSGLLLRQIIAAVFVILAMYYYDKKSRNVLSFILLFIGFNFHVTSLFFLPFLMLRNFDQLLLGKKIGLVLIFFLMLVLYGPIVTFLYQFLAGIPGVGFILFKLSNKSFVDLGRLNIIEILYPIGILIIYILIYMVYSSKKTVVRKNSTFLNVGIFLSLFILFYYDTTELSKRFLIYLYALIPVICISFFGLFKRFITILLPINVFFGFYFIFKLFNSFWSYKFTLVELLFPVVKMF